MYSSYNSLKQAAAAVDDQCTAIVVSPKVAESKPLSLLHRLNAKVPARVVLYLLSWSGFLVSFMMRNDINLALVAMTTPTNVTALSSSNGHNDSLHNNVEDSTSNSDSTQTAIAVGNAVYYDWSSSVQTMIKSSFFWCYVLSQVFGGIATQYFGTKKVFGWSQFATAICSLSIPLFSDMHYGFVIALRSIQGIASGLTWPAMYAIVGFWIPLVERSRFMSSFQGFSIGTGLAFVLGGFIIKRFSWQYVFYTNGTLGLLWCVFWYALAFNTPQEHPRITKEELEYIEVNISSETKNSLGKKVPWKEIITSKPAWAIGITTFGRIWITYVFITYGPNFMKSILHFDYQANGILTGMPHICSYVTSVIFCYIADKMLNKHCMTLKNIRKLFTALSQIVPGILMLALGYVDDVVQLLVIWFIAISFITASYAGAMANIVDIAPNFAGPVLAFCQTIHMSASFISPLISGLILHSDTDINLWRTVFILSSAVGIVTYVAYQIYGTADVQKWDNIVSNDCAKNGDLLPGNDYEGDDDEENQMLNGSKNDTTASVVTND